MVHSSGDLNNVVFHKYFHLFRRPGFRESAFQPFKKEDDDEADKTKEKPLTEEEDSEADEMVDIEKIEDKEEDNKVPTTIAA